MLTGVSHKPLPVCQPPDLLPDTDLLLETLFIAPCWCGGQDGGPALDTGELLSSAPPQVPGAWLESPQCCYCPHTTEASIFPGSLQEP